MLVNIKGDDVLQKLQESNYTFFLTGSRYFRNEMTNNIGVDWDFFTQDAAGLNEFLKELGFEINTTEYKDVPGCLWIFTRQKSGFQDKIDIQVLEPKQLEAKNRVQETVKESKMNFYSLSKDSRKFLWTVFLKVFEAGRNGQ